MASSSQQFRKIHDIIASELVVRQNNVNFTQEYGEVGSSTNVYVNPSTNEVVFETKRIIHEDIFVTINGVSLARDVHYTVDRPNIITISTPAGVDPTTATVLVGYHYNVGAVTVTNNFLPAVVSFYSTPTEGQDGAVLLDFNIDANGGEQITWYILKDGGAAPIFEGTGLVTANGQVVDLNGNLITLEYIVTPAEWAAGEGGQITFTLGVSYVMSNGTGSGTLFENTAYGLAPAVPLAFVGSVVVSPEIVSTVGAHAVTITYAVENIPGVSFNWGLYRNNTTNTTLDSSAAPLITGSSDSPISGVFTDSVVLVASSDYTASYTIIKREVTDTVDVTLATAEVLAKTTTVITIASITVSPTDVITAGVTTIDVSYNIDNTNGVDIDWQLVRESSNKSEAPSALDSGSVLAGAFTAVIPFTDTLTPTNGSNVIYTYVVKYRASANPGDPYLALSSGTVTVSVPTTISGVIQAAPSLISVAGDYSIRADFDIQANGATYDWEVYVSKIGKIVSGVNTLIGSGTNSGDFLSFVIYSINVAAKDDYLLEFSLNLKEAGESSFTTLDASTTTVDNAAAAISGSSSMTALNIVTDASTDVTLNASLVNNTGGVIEWRIEKVTEVSASEIPPAYFGESADNPVIIAELINYDLDPGDNWTDHYYLSAKIKDAVEDFAVMAKSTITVNVPLNAGEFGGTLSCTPNNITNSTETADLEYIFDNANGFTYDWRILKSSASTTSGGTQAAYAIFASAENVTGDATATLTDPATYDAGNDKTVTYSLEYKEAGDTAYIEIDNAILTSNVTITTVLGTVTPTMVVINTEATHTLGVAVSITNPNLEDLMWVLEASRTGELPVEIAAGSGATSVINSLPSHSVIVGIGESYDIAFALKIKKTVDDASQYQTYFSSVVRVDTINLLGLSGTSAYIEHSMMFVPAVGGNVELGSIGTLQDLVNLNSYVPASTFTGVFGPADAAPINTPLVVAYPAGTVVYAVFIVPKVWGEVIFSSPLGDIPETDFNVFDKRNPPGPGHGDNVHVYRKPQLVGRLEDIQLRRQ